MNYLKIAVMTVLLLTSLVALGSGKQLSTWLGETPAETSTGADLAEVEAVFNELEFDPANSFHQIRHDKNFQRTRFHNVTSQSQTEFVTDIE